MRLKNYTGNVKAICPICKKQFESFISAGKKYCSMKCYHKSPTRGKRFKCANKACYKKFSVTVGTVFEGSNIPLTTWFAAMYLIASHKKGISSIQLGKDLGVTQKTAWFLLHRIRESLREKNSPLLRDVIETDETFIGGKNRNRHADKKIEGDQGRSTKSKKPVFGLIQRGGNVNTVVVPDTKASTLKPIIKKLVEKGSIVITDEWTGYSGLGKHFPHVVLKHNDGEYVRGAFHTNSIESYWAVLKRGIYGIYHSVSPKHLHRYCDEFSYRFNSRKIADNERFDITLKRINGRLKYNDLIKNDKAS